MSTVRAFAEAWDKVFGRLEQEWWLKDSPLLPGLGLPRPSLPNLSDLSESRPCLAASSKPKGSGPSGSFDSIGSGGQVRKTTNGTKHSWIVTATGRKFNPLDPDPEQINLEDIAHALSNICRFTGHCREFYSVAQHSVLVSLIAEAEAFDLGLINPWYLGLKGLLHDASEAYLCDVARPLKRHEGFSQYRIAETRLMGAVMKAFFDDGFELIPEIVKVIDERIVTNEAYALMPTLPEGWQLRTGFTTLELETQANNPNPFTPTWTPTEAKQQFLQRYQQLMRTKEAM